MIVTFMYGPSYLLMMDNEAEFIARLIGFGLSEKEARAYLHLLTYGPKTPSPLAKSLKTYREDVHRTLTGLMDKGMVRPSLDSPTVYAAVDLDSALQAAVNKQESELREMEARKRELQELSQQQRFRPSDDVKTFKIIKNVKELISVGIASTTSGQEEVLVVSPPEIMTIASLFGVTDEVGNLIERGATFRLVTDIAYSAIQNIEEALSIGEDIRHYGKYGGIFFAVLDRRICFQGINIDVSRISLNEPLAVIWSDDPTYAKYLIETFEMIWQQAIPAAERIQQLQEQGPPLI
ncbi:MAG: helix-turn-helix domain-containing protein [Halobacteriota archaeon]